MLMPQSPLSGEEDSPQPSTSGTHTTSSKTRTPSKARSPYKKKAKTSSSEDVPFAEAMKKMFEYEDRMAQERRVCELNLHSINLLVHTINIQYQ